ncbi:GNAT family N-acetyltransferase [Aspergillus affinis]|uniref:GNAT family N-acetyltransferase n=1 Tax=Aspergillus affinis TaxID=1070780 RepID=UPI0022FF01D0|nr:uncharacterized protein KD926_006336 [Aspergillus affinis]KAI9041999.1 hypothetical protein KD926_006336 [Aspergillus affinis]
MAIEVVPLTEADIPGAIEVIQQAFAEDPYFEWVFDAPNFNKQRNHDSLAARCLWGINNALFHVAKETDARVNGEVVDPTDQNSANTGSSRIVGVSCWLPPHASSEPESWYSWYQGWVLFFRQFMNNLVHWGRGGLISRRYWIWKERQAEAQSAIWDDPKGYYFCNIVAVKPDAQGGGIGRKLFEKVTEQADREGVKSYLESSRNEPNVPIYEKMGFEMKRVMECRDGDDACMVESKGLALVLLVGPYYRLPETIMTQPNQQLSNLHFRSDASQSNSLSSAGKVGLILGLIAGVTLIVLLVIYIVLRLKRGPVITLSSFLPHPSRKAASLRNLPSDDIERGLRSRATDRSASRATTTRTTRTTRTTEKDTTGGRGSGGGRRQTSSPAHSHSQSHRKVAPGYHQQHHHHLSSLDKELGLKKKSAGGGGSSDRGWMNVMTRDFHADPHGPTPTNPLNTSRDLNHNVTVTMPVSAYALPHERMRDPVRVPPRPVIASPGVPPSPAFSRLTTSTASSAALPSARFMPGMRKSEEA